MDNKLFPPQIAGSLPAFYKAYDLLTNLSTGAKITVPFVMNAGVGEAEVKGFALRLKTSSSNTYICPVLFSRDWDKEKSEVTFHIIEEYANKLKEGQFYKVQIAYYTYKEVAVLDPETGKYEQTVIDPDNIDNFLIGYYSTVGIIKCVSKPEVSIEGYSRDSVNLFTGSYLGVYDATNSLDKTEKVYSYRFDFFDTEDNLVRTSGELIHNVNNDAEYNYSVDRYTCSDFIKQNDVYKLVYTVTTMNGLVASSPRYKVTSNTKLAPGRMMEVTTIPMPEDGCIDVSLMGEKGLSPEGKMEEALYYGEFVLSRASEEDGYVEWEQISEFRLSNQKPSSFHFLDFSVKQGTKYIYGVQQFNMSKLYSTRILSKPISVDFEDMFLFDGERSLRIKFNPKVSSFKTTHLEKKVDTIGNKYPFIFRNGAVAYKNFPIEGLISYHIDENQRFYDRDEIYGFFRQSEERDEVNRNRREATYFSTDLVEENILLERKFKLEVLDWLNDGNPKLFKSGTEGNYIVRLMKVSLKPVDKLGRMLHSFKADAVEIADCTLANLKKFGFSIGEAISGFVPLWRTYDFTKLNMSPDGRGKELIFEQEVSSFRIENVLPGTKVYIYYENDSVPEEIMIGASGAYFFSDSDRRVTKLIVAFENGLNIQGQIECEYIGRRYSNFDAITDIKLQTIVSNQTIGTNPDLEAMQISVPSIPNFNLAVRALADTNYRTYLNKYLVHASIEDYLLGNLKSTKFGSGEDWVSLLKDLDLIDSNGFFKNESSFDPSDTIQYIQTDFNDFERNKLTILNMEQATVRQRELIPVYVVPYRMIGPDGWLKMDDEARQFKKQPGGYYTKEDYEHIAFPTEKLLFSTTPFGRPYPIDDLVTYLTLLNPKYEKLIDNHFVYAIYKYNEDEDKWYLINNHDDVAPAFSGSYYDSYRKRLLQTYDTTYYINERYRYDPITKEDVIKQGNYYLRKGDKSCITNDAIYIKKGNEYVLASDEFNFRDRYTFWIAQEEPDVYYARSKNNIDIKYSKQMEYDNLGPVKYFGISNGIIVEQTFQLQITDYYTEVNDMPTKLAKEKYLEAAKFLRDIFFVYGKIEDADMKRHLYKSLYTIYNVLLSGSIKAEDKIMAYDLLILLIMLEESEIDIKTIEQFFIPEHRLNGVGYPNPKDIIINLKLLCKEYRNEQKVPTNILINRMFETNAPGFKAEYTNWRNALMLIYNLMNKYSMLKLIDGEKEDLMSLFTDEIIEGLESKQLKLKTLYDLILEEVDKKNEEMADLAKQFKSEQENVRNAYEQYNLQLAKYAANAWIARLRQLNPAEESGSVEDFLLMIERYYAKEANMVDIGSQYAQELIAKWKAKYDTAYNTMLSLVEENRILLGVQEDQDDDKDLDDYILKVIRTNFVKIIVYARQLETIENETVLGQPILTEDDLKNYPNRKLEDNIIDKTFDYYTDMTSKLNRLIVEIIAYWPEVKDAYNSNPSIGTVINKIKELNIQATGDQERLISVIKQFIVDTDKLQMFKEFTNWTGSPIFTTFGAVQSYIDLREIFLTQVLPASALTGLDRPLLIFNANTENENKDFKTNGEQPWYLMSRLDTDGIYKDAKAYKVRLEWLLKHIRYCLDYLATYGLGADKDVADLLKQCQDVNLYEKNGLQAFFTTNEKLDTINKEITEANISIEKYVELLKLSPIIADSDDKWNELIAEYKEKSYYSDYIEEEPDNWKNKINNGVLKDTPINALTYVLESKPELREGAGFFLDGVNILSVDAEGVIKENKDTFFLSYNHFSDLYQKLIGWETAEDDRGGMLFWYIDVVMSSEIDYQRIVLSQMQTLLDDYNRKLGNYNTKRQHYKEQHESSETIFNEYGVAYPDVFKYYLSNSSDKDALIDNAIKKAKIYWNLFILELDLGFKREIERGMYG